MNFQNFLEKMTPEMAEALRRAIEVGQWDNGIPLSQEHKDLGIQSLIAWDHKNTPKDQRIGYIPTACRKNKNLPKNIMRVQEK